MAKTLRAAAAPGVAVSAVVPVYSGRCMNSSCNIAKANLGGNLVPAEIRRAGLELTDARVGCGSWAHFYLHL